MAKRKDSTTRPMALFRIGQRVMDTESERAGVISSELGPCCNVKTGQRYWGYGIVLDELGASKRWRGRQYDYGASQTNLRPIYDGNETVAWSACAWRPMVVTASVAEKARFPRSEKLATAMRAKWADPEFRERNRAGKARAALRRQAEQCAATVSYLRRQAEEGSAR